MRRLQLGMWHQCDPARWERYSLGMLNGLEISGYQDEAELEKARTFCDRHGLQFGVHGPILSGRGYELPLLLSPDAAERGEALRRVEAETELASRYGADYILFHYPYLPVFQPPLRRRFARMPDAAARYGYDRLPIDRFRSLSERLFAELEQLQRRYDQRIVLEHDFFGDYGDWVAEAFENHPSIGLVVDTARLDIAAKAFHDFDPFAWLERTASSVYVVHYSNVHYADETFVHHLPVRKGQDGDATYGEAYAYLAFVAARNSRFHLTFEHDADRVGTDELAEIYRRAAAVCGLTGEAHAAENR
ncbi:hypothetical protein GCM10020370_11540 [Paenibacillus hodogayensis]